MRYGAFSAISLFGFSSPNVGAYFWISYRCCCLHIYVSRTLACPCCYRTYATPSISHVRTLRTHATHCSSLQYHRISHNCHRLLRVLDCPLQGNAQATVVCKINCTLACGVPVFGLAWLSWKLSCLPDRGRVSKQFRGANTSFLDSGVRVLRARRRPFLLVPCSRNGR